MIADSRSQQRTSSFVELLQRAQDDQLDPDVARSVGAELADHFLRDGNLDKAPLEQFTAEAYLGFDARVAEVQSSTSATTA